MAEIRRPKGFFLLQPGEDAVLNTASRRVTEKELRNPKISGLTIRFRRPWVRPNQSVWDWAFVDNCVDFCHRINKPYKLLLMSSGESRPPWDQRRLDFYGEIIFAAGERYANDKLMVGWHVTGGTRKSTSEELHPELNWNNDAGIVKAYKFLTDCSNAAFPNISLWLAASVKYRAKHYIKEIITHGIQKAPGRFGVKNNQLRGDKPGTEDAPHNELIIWAAKKGALQGYEMVQPVGDKINEAIQFGFKMAKRAGTRPEDLYVDVYKPDGDNITDDTYKMRGV